MLWEVLQGQDYRRQVVRGQSAISCSQMDLESAMQTSNDNNEMGRQTHSGNLITAIQGVILVLGGCKDGHCEVVIGFLRSEI